MNIQILEITRNILTGLDLNNNIRISSKVNSTTGNHAEVDIFRILFSKIDIFEHLIYKNDSPLAKDKTILLLFSH